MPTNVVFGALPPTGPGWQQLSARRPAVGTKVDIGRMDKAGQIVYIDTVVWNSQNWKLNGTWWRSYRG
jgi:hypothetical protein